MVGRLPLIMSSVWPRLEPILPRVSKPARYIGGEDGAQAPEHHPAKVAWLLAYPDTYEIGLPNQGLQILYEILNERDDAVAERTYAPWTDLGIELRAHDVPLFSVDTHLEAAAFDVLAFNLSAELTYTNLLDMVDLARCPIRAADRTDDDLFIGAGGHCTYNPEPIAAFLDFVVLGDGEEAVGEITEVLAAWKARRAGGEPVVRLDALAGLAGIEGVYVPSLYESTWDGDGRLLGTGPVHPAAPDLVEKRTIADLGDWPYPKNQLVPLTEVVHDRLNVEVFRGCTRGCRFCQAGMITRPVRERPADQVRTMVAEGLRRTGYDEVALTSLSTADFSGIEAVVSAIVAGDAPPSAGASPEPVGQRIDGESPSDAATSATQDAPAPQGPGSSLDCGGSVGGLASDISVSLPSLRVDAFTVGIAAEIQRARRTGLTFAPEGGSWRMRQVINKLISDDDLYGAVESAYSQGWRRMKLYFLIGLPTETDEDTLGIAALARNVVEIGRKYHKNPSVTVSIGGFVPKPFTPFQWFGQNTREELHRKVGLLRDELRRDRGVQLKWHDPKATTVEGIMSRGDRRLADVIEDVWRHGGTFQEWSEHFDLQLWLDALDRAGLTVEELVYRHRLEDEALPWDHLSAGLHKDFLWQDWRDALDEVGLEDCRWTPCYDCGACTGYGIEHVVANATPPAGGSQGTGASQGVPVSLGPRPTPAGVG